MALDKNKSRVLLVGLLAGGFIGSLSQNMLTSALPSIMREFGVKATLGQWLTTIYILVLGLVTSVTAYLINKYEVKKLFISSLSIFLMGSIISYFAPNFTVLLFSRVIQACGAGVLLPLSQVMVLKIYPVEKHGAAMGIIGIVVGTAPAIGPTLSGLIVDYFGWRYIFLFLIAAALIVISSSIFMKLKTGEKFDGKLDIPSVILYGAGFTGLMLGVTNQDAYGWIDLHTLIPFVVGFICIYSFVYRQIKLPNPLLKIKILRNTRFALGTILIIVTYIVSMSGTIMVPIYIQSVMGLSAATSGIVLLPGASLIAILSPITGHLYDKIGARKISFIGMLLLTIGNGAFTFFRTDTNIVLITAMYTIRMAGIAFLLMPLQAYGLSGLEKIDYSHGTAIINSFRQISGALGSAILVAIMTATSAKGEVVDIRGINISFGVETIFIILAMILAMIFIKEDKRKILNKGFK